MTGRIQLELADYALGIRGKVVHSDKLAPGKRPAFCTILYGLDAADDVADTDLSSAANGYPDAFVAADEATRVVLPWRRDTTAVLAGLTDIDGVPLEQDPRNLLSRLTADVEMHGVTPVLGFEYEMHVFEAPPGPVTSLAALTPFTRLRTAYSLSRVAVADDLAGEYVDRMQSVGVAIEAVHTELGDGFFEFALAPAPALQAADGAVRAKQYFKDLCAERGLLASFMAKPRADASGAGGHVHQSLSRQGVNVFADQPGELSSLGRAYLAGLLETMGDLTLLMCPNPNSYRRLDARHFVPEQASGPWSKSSCGWPWLGSGLRSWSR